MRINKLDTGSQKILLANPKMFEKNVEAGKSIAKTMKHQDRSEKKKRKLAALARLIQLNDSERSQMHAGAGDGDEETSSEGSAVNDGSTSITTTTLITFRKNQTDTTKINDSSDEPGTKRARLTSTENAMNVGKPDDNSNSNHDSYFDQNGKELTEAQYSILRRQLRERKRMLEDVPSLRLREYGERASLQVPQEQRTPIFITDIQHLIMRALIGPKSPCCPKRWCSLNKSCKLSHSVVVILEGLSLFHYVSNESQFQKINQIFDTRLEVMLPPCKEGIIVEELVQVPLTNIQANKLIEEYGCLETAVEMNKDPTLLVKAIFPVDSKTKREATESDICPGDKFPRTKLLLSALQMVDDGYPMPLRGELHTRFNSYVFTKERYTPVNNRSPMFGVDCEMCRTTAGVNELTRISIVNEEMKIVYESFVRPNNKITDYLTKYSGITPDLMKGVTKTLREVQKEVQSLLPTDAILVGQSLNSDLNAMKMMHPYVIDTSVCFNLSGVRRRKSKLQTLAMTFLKESIQDSKDGHDSIEDSIASLKLVKMKLANSVDFGDEILTQKKRVREIVRLATGDEMKNNLCAHLSQRDKSTAIVTVGTLQKNIKDVIQKANDDIQNECQKSISLFELDTNKEAVYKVREVALEHALTIANLRLCTDQVQFEFEKTLGKLDKWIGKVWKSMAHNGMLLVLMGGSPECPSGVAKIAIKKNPATVSADLPISI